MCKDVGRKVPPVQFRLSEAKFVKFVAGLGLVQAALEGEGLHHIVHLMSRPNFQTFQS